MRPLRVERELAVRAHVARLLVGEEHFRARAGPLDRPAELLRREQRGAILGVEVEAHAEAAADLLGDDADLLRRHAEHRGELVAHDRHALRAGVEMVLIGHEGGEAGARLHRVADHARDVHVHLHHSRRALERGARAGLVAGFVVEHHVAGHRVVHQRRAGGERFGRVHHRRQLAVLDGDQLGRVLRGDRGLGDDERDRVAGEAHAPLRQRRPAGIDQLHAAAALHRQRRRQRLQHAGEVGAGEHRDHAGMAAKPLPCRSKRSRRGRGRSAGSGRTPGRGGSSRRHSVPDR